MVLGGIGGEPVYRRPVWRTAMSQICAATKTNLPDLEFPDFLGNGGAYEATVWITSVLPGKFGNRRNAGG
jgi:hypothetical protein